MITNSQRSLFKENFPLLNTYVEMGRLLLNDIDFDISGYKNYIRNEDMWDTIYIKAGDVGARDFMFFTQNSLNMGINYFSNSIGNQWIPLTTAMLIKKITASIRIITKDDLKFKVDMNRNKNSVIEITVPNELQEIIDTLLNKTVVKLTYRQSIYFTIPLCQIATINNIPTLEGINNDGLFVCKYGTQPDMVKEWEQYILLNPNSSFSLSIKFPYDAKLAKDVYIQLRLHGDRYESC